MQELRRIGRSLNLRLNLRTPAADRLADFRDEVLLVGRGAVSVNGCQTVP
jgi:hypothetical protein